ncbi:MAG: rhodanese-like domain-containing protein, partial [Candidatus Bipolaricaulota bacterium]
PPEGTGHTEGITVDPSRVMRSYNVVLDIRPEEAYAEGHIPGAVNLPADEVLDWAESLPAADQLPNNAQLQLWVVDEGQGEACQLAQELQDAGQEAAMCMVGGFAEWKVRVADRLVWEGDEG